MLRAVGTVALNTGLHGVALVFAASCAFTTLGCNNGPPRYDVSGTANYDGKPIPAGVIVLNADHQAGNSGPQGRAEIIDGQISIKDGMGTVGGAQWIQIMGSDGKSFKDHEGQVQQGKALFATVQQKIDLPKNDITLTIQINPVKAKGKSPTVDIQVAE